VLGHSEGLLDAPQLVVDIDDELCGLADEIGGVALPAGQRPGLGLQGPVHRLRGTRELDVAVAFDRGMAVNGAFGHTHLLVDTTQGLASPIVTELVMDHPIRDAAGLFATGRWPRLG
jgi:hypothetical protein